MKKTKAIPHFDVSDIDTVEIPGVYVWLNARNHPSFRGPRLTGEWWLRDSTISEDGTPGKKWVTNEGLASSQGKELTKILGIRPIITLNHSLWNDQYNIPFYSEVEIGRTMFTKVGHNRFLSDSIVVRTPYTLPPEDLESVALDEDGSVSPDNTMSRYLNSDNFKSAL